MSSEYITTDEGLAGLCAHLREHDWFVLDTEFIRERTYSPQLCLLQVATPERLACVDPLSIGSLEPFLDLLFDPGITKVLHAARQDLEIFFNMRGAVPAPIFDTQIAATVLGHGDQVGYGALVHVELGVELDKTQSRTDWAQRPLSPAQLEYAADDVRYLRELYPLMRERLATQGRSDWLAEDFAALSDPGLYRVEPDEAWRRIKGSNRLKGQQLAVLQRLAAWRERAAQERDKPRRWILKDDPLLDLARIMPTDADQLGRIRGLDGGFLSRHGETLLGLVREAKALPMEAWPRLPKVRRLAPEQEPIVDLLSALLRVRCQEQAVSPAAVAGRKDLERVLLGDTDVNVLHGWRRALAGAELQRLLMGELTLSVEGGRLASHPTD